MIHITDTALKVLAGICVGSGLHHLFAGARRYRPHVNISFAVMCLAVAAVALLSGRIYRSTSIASYEATADTLFATLAVFNAAFVWFVTYYAGVKRRRFAIALSLACGLWFVGGVTGVISSVVLLHDVTLSWGETVMTADTRATPGLVYITLVGAAIYLYVFGACIRLYRRGGDAPAVGLAVGTAILLVAVAHDLLLSRHVFGGMYLAEYGFLGLILVMTLWITNDFVRASRIKRSLIESEERFRELAELLPNTVFELDANGVVTYVNRAGLEMFGYHESDADARLYGFAMISDADRPTAQARVQRLLAGEDIGMNEYMALRKDGTTFPAMFQSAAIMRHGQVAGIRGVAIDMSENKRLENELRQTHKMEAVGTLAGGIAHDFNNILSAIIGYSELVLAQVGDRPDAERDIGKVIRSGERARDLVRQILTFSRQTDLRPRAVGLKVVVAECLDLLRASFPSTIEIQRALDSDAVVIADPTQIHQIVMNLCTNAAHAMDDGGTLRVELTDVRPEDNRFPGNPLPVTSVRLSVYDTGHGIDAAVQERMFEPFFSTRDSRKGTGLGLSMVYGITKQLGGVVAVESTRGAGSVFHVEIPVADAGRESEVDHSGTPARGSERILYVDDEEMLALLAQRALTHLGYEVTIATDSEAALEAFRLRPEAFDLIFADMTMPHMTGLTLSNKMLSIRPDVPIILCTGFSEQLSGVDVEAYGIRRLVMKPLTQKDMARHVREVLDGVPTDIIGQRHI